LQGGQIQQINRIQSLERITEHLSAQFVVMGEQKESRKKLLKQRRVALMQWGIPAILTCSLLSMLALSWNWQKTSDTQQLQFCKQASQEWAKVTELNSLAFRLTEFQTKQAFQQTNIDWLIEKMQRTLNWAKTINARVSNQSSQPRQSSPSARNQTTPIITTGEIIDVVIPPYGSSESR
jgi:hypothetical protein